MSELLSNRGLTDADTATARRTGFVSRIVLVGALLAIALLGVARANEDSFTSADPFTSFRGAFGGEVYDADSRTQALTVNPSGIGQVLIGPYYDVRPLVAPNGTQQAQLTQIKITNVAAANADNEAILFRLKFNDSKYGSMLLGVAGIVGCGQSWVGTVFARTDGTPAIRSSSQTLSNLPGNASQATLIESVKGLDFPNGAPFKAVPFVSLTLADMQRGYFEIFPELAVSCAPSLVSAQGVSSWSYSGDQIKGSPGNVLSGSVTIVTSSGHRASYPLVAVSRYRLSGDPVDFGAGPVPIGNVTVPFSSFTGQLDLPTIFDCLFLDAGLTPHTSAPGCSNQFQFSIAKSRLYVPFDDDAGSSVRTRLILTQPSRSQTCLLPLSGTARPPYSCKAGGERIGTRVTDAGGQLGKWKSLILPRSLTIVSVATIDDPNADVSVKGLSSAAGTVEFSLDKDRKSGEAHGQAGDDPNVFTFLGSGFTGYKGLPVLALVLREWNSPQAPGEFEFERPTARAAYQDAPG